MRGTAASGPVRATELLTELRRARIGPELRAMGFRGSGRDWSLPNRGRDHALLSFQRSTYNDASEAAFTATVLVARRAEWEAAAGREPWLGTRPSATADGGPAWRARIGELLELADDRWWTPRSAQDVDDVLHLVRGVVTPDLRARRERVVPPPPYPRQPLSARDLG